MVIRPFAILIAIVAIIMIISTVIQFTRRKITASWALFWSALWILGTVGVFFSAWVDVVGDYFIGGEGRFLVIYVAIIMLFYLFYKLFLWQQRTERAMSKLVEELAKKK